MLNLKKTLALFLTAGFIYEGNAAMARDNKGDFVQQSVARRLLTKKPGFQLSRPFSRAGKGFFRLPMRSRFLIKRQGPQWLTRTVTPLRKKGTAQLARPFSQRLQPAMRTAPGKATKVVVQPMKRFSKQQFISARRTVPITAGKAVVRPMRSLAKTEPLSPRTTSARIQPKTDFPAIRKGGGAPVKSNQQILIKASDIPPGLTAAFAAREVRSVYYSATREELVGIVRSLKALEDTQQLLPGTTQSLRDTLRRKYNVTL